MKKENVFSSPALHAQFNSRGILVLISIVVAALAADAMVSNVADFLSNKIIASSWGISLFIGVTASYALGQYFILGYTKEKSREVVSRSSFFNNINTVVRISQYTLIAILLVIILQILLTSHYHVFTLAGATAVSYILAISMMMILSQRFFSWFRTNRNPIVLSYGTSSAALAIAYAIVVTLMLYALLGKSGEITPQSQVVYPTFDEPGSLTTMLHEVYDPVGLATFALTWVSTALLLRQHSQRLKAWKKARYWIFMAIPFAGLLSSYVIFSYFPDLLSLLNLDQFQFIVLLTLNTTAISILFGIAFWSIGRSISRQSGSNATTVRGYINIAAVGFVLLFISDQSSVIAVAYPPFGYTTVSFTGLAAYLILIGVYCSAISVSHDIELRKSIRKSVRKESGGLLGSIGEAQMERELETRVIKMAKDDSDNMTQKSGVQPSFGENDMKEYLKQVIKEVKSSSRSSSAVADKIRKGGEGGTTKSAHKDSAEAA